MVDPIASVIIPTHNRDVDLARAANSALAQSIPNIEVIVINDASTDQTKEVLAILEAMDSRLRVLHLPIPLGLSGGLQRNEGIKAARGKYICYVDDDDVMTYRSVQDRMEFLEANEDLDYCWGRTFFIRNNVGHRALDHRVTTRLVKEPGGPKVHWVEGTIIPNDLMHRAGVVGEESGVWWPYGRGEDRRLLMALVDEGFRGKPVDAVVSIYGRSGAYDDTSYRRSQAQRAREGTLPTATPAAARLPTGFSERLRKRSGT